MTLLNVSYIEYYNESPLIPDLVHTKSLPDRQEVRKFVRPSCLLLENGVA